MPSKQKVAVLTGAGISAESGINTFRDAGGLWEGHDVMDVASPQGFKKNPQLVLDFYNARRSALEGAQPNAGHLALAKLEEGFEVHIITQNVDDLHERAGSTQVLHLHGELTKIRSTKFGNEPIDHGYKPLNLGDICEAGYQLRPHIVWFGEEVPLLEIASHLVSKADYLLIVGTSLQVYPAAGLMHYAKRGVPVYYIDPNPAMDGLPPHVKVFPSKAGEVLPGLVRDLLLAAK